MNHGEEKRWNVFVSFYETFKFSHQMAQPFSKEDTTLHSVVQQYPFGAEIFFNIQCRLHQFSSKVFNGIFTGCALNAGERLDR